MKTHNFLSLISLFAILLLSMCKGTEEISLPPVAAFSGNPISGEAPLTVNFTDQSTNDPTSHGWDFGDGTTSTQQNPAKTYTNAGNYTVKLTATNSYGSDTHIKNNYIAVSIAGAAPVAAFTATPTNGTAPLAVNFTDQSVNNPTSWAWDFGDGTTSTQLNPTKTYTNAGSYTVKLTATNSYGSDMHIKSNYIEVTSGGGGTTGQPCPGTPTVTDIDGNVYNTVQIGNQCWMKENLKTTKYRNGISIEYPGSNNTDWKYNTLGAYAWSNNNISWKDTYGALYNWYAVNNVNNLCPTGWHVPSEAEWTQLVDYVVSQGYPNVSSNPNGAGNALKSCRQVNSPLGGDCNTSVHPRWNSNATHHGFDTFGFSAFAGGDRNNSGSFGGPGQNGYYWSSTEQSATTAWQCNLRYSIGYVNIAENGKHGGGSIRCLKD